TDHGTVELQFDDPAARVDVEIDGQQFKLVTSGDTIRVRAGRHTLQAVGKDFEMEGESFAVKRNDRTLVRVKFRPRPAAAVPPRERDPKERVAALIQQGRDLKDSKEYDRAIAVFSEALALAPDSAAAYAQRGHARFLKREYDAALRDYQEALRLAPDEA